MKALFVIASLCFWSFVGLLGGEQGSAPASGTEEIAQIRKQIETLEERVERLEMRLDGTSRPRMVPLTSSGVSRKLR